MSEMSIFNALYQGPSNRFACGALTAIAHMPGEIYNPLWLHGPSGVGKTAMLQATADALRDHPSRPLVLYIQTERLVHDMIRAIQRDCTEDFQARILSFQVILVDHADCLSGMEVTQRSFAKLLLEAVNQGSQVILVSGCQPAELPWVEKVFNATCEWRLCCDIAQPSLEERLAIVRLLSQSLPLSDQMVSRIAHAAHTPARIRCIIHHLTARRKLLRLEDAALSEALDHLLEQEVCA